MGAERSGLKTGLPTEHTDDAEGTNGLNASAALDF